MVLSARRRARRAGALVASLVGLSLALPPAEAKPKPEPDSGDVTFVVTDPGTPKGKGKAKPKGKGDKGAKPASKKATPKPAQVPKSKPKPATTPKPAPKPVTKSNPKPATPAPKPSSGKAKPAAADSDDVVLTTTAADGTKVEEVELEEDESLAAPPPAPEESPRGKAKLNWAGLYFQQDSLIFSSVNHVCPSVDASGKKVPGNPDYSCRDVDSVYKSRVYSGAGNQVSGGFGVATSRLMLGYDRVFIDRVTAGARLGFAFREAPTVEGVGASLPVHLELRGAYHLLGTRPFEEGGLHPFAGLGLGLAEVDSVVTVDFYTDAAAYAAKKHSRLHAWRRTGTGFAAPTIGATYGIAGLLFTADLRLLILFPATGVGPALGLGAAYGF